MPAADFVSLAELLLGGAAHAPAPAGPCEGDAAGAGCDVGRTDVAQDRSEPNVPDPSDDLKDAWRDARLFRAQLEEAFDDALARMLRDLAADVLVRELRLAPCDLAALIGRAVQRAPFVRVRVAAGDGARDYAIPSVVDPKLESGDAILELSGGALDLRLGVRLATVLEPLP